jgi:hypothetical protein
MVIIPQRMVVIQSWRVFILCTALLNVLSAIAFLWMPESPKFLAGRGREAEAVRVLARIHAANRRGRGDPGQGRHYPVSEAWRHQQAPRESVVIMPYSVSGSIPGP